jgi:hypothetical protein
MRLEDLPSHVRAQVERQAQPAKPRGRKLRATPAPGPDFEALLAFQMEAAGLPIPTRQFQFAPGRKYPADFAWPVYSLLVEVQGGIWRRRGGAHSHPTNILRDVEKLQLAVINGFLLFPVTTDEVKNGQALKLVELALQSRGWKR